MARDTLYAIGEALIDIDPLGSALRLFRCARLFAPQLGCNTDLCRPERFIPHVPIHNNSPRQPENPISERQMFLLFFLTKKRLKSNHLHD